MQLTQEQYKKYNAMGYTDEDITNAISQAQQDTELKNSLASAESTNDPMDGSQQSMFSNANDENLIKWQLELDSILERIEHILRGDKVTYKNGNTIWTKAEESERTLNDFGVSEVLNVLSCYLNRNTILSNYDEETINFKVFDLGNEVSDLIYMKTEAMGMDTVEKRKKYPMLVRMIVDMAHSAYLRALHGGERDSLREARQINQNESLNNPGGVNVNMPMKERGMLNPFRYIGGKYK